MNILKEWQRMCRAMSNEVDDCSWDCPIVGNCPITSESITEIDIEDMEQEIAKWAKANPLKRVLMTSRRSFPICDRPWSHGQVFILGILDMTFRGI